MKEAPVTALATSPTRRLIVLGAPLTFAAVSVFHPLDHPAELGGAVARWMTVHVLQLDRVDGAHSEPAER
jgi:hypothetical protein